jgi:hypothetical protein
MILRRMSIIPFETAIAALMIIAGFSSLLHIGILDPVYAMLPSWESLALSVMSILSGIMMMVGIAADRGHIEQAGLLFLNRVILARFMLYGHFFGYGENFIQIGVFYLVILISSAARSFALRKRHVVVMLKDIDDISGKY